MEIIEYKNKICSIQNMKQINIIFDTNITNPIIYDLNEEIIYIKQSLKSNAEVQEVYFKIAFFCRLQYHLKNNALDNIYQRDILKIQSNKSEIDNINNIVVLDCLAFVKYCLNTFLGSDFNCNSNYEVETLILNQYKKIQSIFNTNLLLIV